jgi:hypothetical protein
LLCKYTITPWSRKMSSWCNITLTIFRRVRKIVKIDHWLRHACLSARPRRTTWLPLDGFSWNFVFEFSRKFIEKFQVSFKSDSNNGYCTWRRMNISDMLFISSWRIRNISDKRRGQSQNTHFMFSNYFSENRAVYDIMWKSIVGPDRLQMTIQYGACVLRAV